MHWICCIRYSLAFKQLYSNYISVLLVTWILKHLIEHLKTLGKTGTHFHDTKLKKRVTGKEQNKDRDTPCSFIHMWGTCYGQTLLLSLHQPQVGVSEITGLFLTEGQELVRQAQGSRLVLSLWLLSVAVKGNPEGSGLALLPIYSPLKRGGLFSLNADRPSSLSFVGMT